MKERVAGKVSIVVPIRNRGPYLKECLDSIKKQTYPHLELILIDDASTDRSLDVVAQWLAENEDFSSCVEIVVTKLPRNVGFSGAVTTGFFLAEGEYIAVQDADDFSHELRIEKQVKFLRDHPEVDLVGTNYVHFRDEDSIRHYTPANWLHYGDDIRRVYQNGGHCICHGTILFRAAVFDEIGGLTRKINGAEDYEFIVKFLHKGCKIENLHDELYFYRRHGEQRSTEFFGKKE